MFRVVYNIPFRRYDLANALGRVAYRLGATWPFTSKKGSKSLFLLASLAEKVPERYIGVKKLLRGVYHEAPGLERRIRFGPARIRLSHSDTYGPYGYLSSFGPQFKTLTGGKRRPDVHFIRAPKHPTGAGVAHELGHVLSYEKGLTKKLTTPSSEFWNEVQANRLGSNLYRQAGGSRLRYWVEMFPNLMTYSPWPVKKVLGR